MTLSLSALLCLAVVCGLLPLYRSSLYGNDCRSSYSFPENKIEKHKHIHAYLIHQTVSYPERVFIPFRFQVESFSKSNLKIILSQ